MINFLSMIIIIIFCIYMIFFVALFAVDDNPHPTLKSVLVGGLTIWVLSQTGIIGAIFPKSAIIRYNYTAIA